jgi:hypothetical protein
MKSAIDICSSLTLKKARTCFTLALDMAVFIPSFPIELALKWLERQLESPIQAGEFFGLWIIFTLVFSVLTALLGIFSPFLILNTVIIISFVYLGSLETLYKSRTCRSVIRAITFGTILFSLWHIVDLRREFKPVDLPSLSNSSSSIRILDLWPADERWGIKADLRTVNLADNPNFEALSYEWGDPRKTHSISVQGKRFSVTANLWNALHNVRHQTETRALWVDAICIDQTNLDEKSTQVPLMSLIYRRANNVLISLGKHTPPRWVEKSDSLTWTSGWIKQTADDYWETTAWWLEQLMIEEYWKRCWVVQEIGSALSVQVYADRKPIPWDKFIQLTTMFESSYPTSKLANRVLRFDSVRKAMYQDGRTYVLGQLLETFKDSFCSVNLDKIYAFAGMAIDCEGECLPVDYAAGAAPLYKALISFQNSTTHQNHDGAIEMVHFAALVRRLLSRTQAKVVKEYEKPGWIYHLKHGCTIGVATNM